MFRTCASERLRASPTFQKNFEIPWMKMSWMRAQDHQIIFPARQPKGSVHCHLPFWVSCIVVGLDCSPVSTHCPWWACNSPAAFWQGCSSLAAPIWACSSAAALFSADFSAFCSESLFSGNLFNVFWIELFSMSLLLLCKRLFSHHSWNLSLLLFKKCTVFFFSQHLWIFSPQCHDKFSSLWLKLTFLCVSTCLL